MICASISSNVAYGFDFSFFTIRKYLETYAILDIGPMFLDILSNNTIYLKGNIYCLRQCRFYYLSINQKSMTTATKRSKLVTYLKNASDGKIDLLYSELEAELEETDDETYNEFPKRSKSFFRWYHKNVFNRRVKKCGFPKVEGNFISYTGRCPLLLYCALSGLVFLIVVFLFHFCLLKIEISELNVLRNIFCKNNKTFIKLFVRMTKFIRSSSTIVVCHNL